MTNDPAIQRYSELVAAMQECERVRLHVKVLDKRIAELAGLVPASETRKTSKKTLSPKDFARGCGM